MTTAASANTAAQKWSRWLKADLSLVEANNEGVQLVADRMQVLLHLRPGNKVLDDVNDTMAGFHFKERAVMVHPDVAWEHETGQAIDKMVGNINFMTDTGRWPEDWTESPLKDMTLVLTAYTACLGQNYKAIVTIMTKAYVGSHTPENVLEQVGDLSLYAEPVLSGLLIALSLTADQQRRWMATTPNFKEQTPVDLAAGLFAVARSDDRAVDVIAP
jgi:hypothetical protein